MVKTIFINYKVRNYLKSHKQIIWRVNLNIFHSFINNIIITTTLLNLYCSDKIATAGDYRQVFNLKIISIYYSRPWVSIKGPRKFTT